MNSRSSRRAMRQSSAKAPGKATGHQDHSYSMLQYLFGQQEQFEVVEANGYSDTPLPDRTAVEVRASRTESNTRLS